MGKGDRRTRRGKIYNGSYGRTRPHRARKPGAAAAAPVRPPAAPARPTPSRGK